MGRMPLRTRGRDDDVAGSDIFLIDSVVKPGECSRLSGKSGETAPLIVAGHCSGIGGVVLKLVRQISSEAAMCPISHPSSPETFCTLKAVTPFGRNVTASWYAARALVVSPSRLPCFTHKIVHSRQIIWFEGCTHRQRFLNLCLSVLSTPTGSESICITRNSFCQVGTRESRCIRQRLLQQLAGAFRLLVLREQASREGYLHCVAFLRNAAGRFQKRLRLGLASAIHQRNCISIEFNAGEPRLSLPVKRQGPQVLEGLAISAGVEEDWSLQESCRKTAARTKDGSAAERCQTRRHARGYKPSA